MWNIISSLLSVDSRRITISALSVGVTLAAVSSSIAAPPQRRNPVIWPPEGLEIGVGYQSLYLTEKAAAREGIGADGSKDFYINALFTLTPRWVAETGWSAVSMTDERPISGGSTWHSVGRNNEFDYGYPEDAGPSRTVKGHALHLQSGYRLQMPAQSTPSGVRLQIDASLGYRGFLGMSRTSGYDGMYTHAVSRSVQVGGGLYLQPKIQLMIPCGRGACFGLQAAYEQYLASDVKNGWMAGVVVALGK